MNWREHYPNINKDKFSLVNHLSTPDKGVEEAGPTDEGVAVVGVRRCQNSPNLVWALIYIGVVKGEKVQYPTSKYDPFTDDTTS